MRRFRRFQRYVAAAIFAIAVISATAGAPANQPVPTPGNHNESLVVGAGVKKMTRTFIVHVPPGFDGKSKVPVVFMLHGAGGSGEGAIPETGWDAKSDREGFIAVFPDGTPPHPLMPARFLMNPRLWNDGSGRGAIGVEQCRRPRLHLRDDRFPRGALRRRSRRASIAPAFPTARR